MTAHGNPTQERELILDPRHDSEDAQAGEVVMATGRIDDYGQFIPERVAFLQFVTEGKHHRMLATPLLRQPGDAGRSMQIDYHEGETIEAVHARIVGSGVPVLSMLRTYPVQQDRDAGTVSL